MDTSQRYHKLPHENPILVSCIITFTCSTFQDMASRLTDRKEMRVSLKLTINSKVRVQFLDFTDSTIVRSSSSAPDDQ